MNQGLEAAFRAAFATPKDRPGDVAAARLAFLHEAALAIDSDVPFPLDRAGYVTAVCTRDGADGGESWRALGLHMSPMMAQILQASPG